MNLRGAVLLEAGPSKRALDDAREIASLLRPEWASRMRALREEGVPRAGHQNYSEVLEPVMKADQTALTAASEGSMWTVATFSAVTANYLYPGKIVRLAAWGIMSTAGTPGTGTITPRWGTTTAGTTLGASVAVALTATMTNVPWFMECKYVCRADGASGVVVAAGNLASQAAPNISFGGTTATCDTTTAQGFFFGWTPSLATASFQTKGLLVEALN